MAFPTTRSSPTLIAHAGQRLKRARERLGLKFRDVEDASLDIARLHNNDEFTIALSRLADIENKGTLPTLFKLYSLCVIYHLDFSEVVSWYGVPLGDLPANATSVRLERTHLFESQGDGAGEMQIPFSLDPGLDLSKTVYLTRMIQRWGKIPFMMLRNMDLRSYRYGLIGTEDWSMFPIIPPGSLVVIDDTRRRVKSSGWSTEFERPIYFLEHRDGYRCGWCIVKENRLTIQSHPSSATEPETFLYPDEIEVIGQVTRVAMTLEPSERLRPHARG